MNKLVIGCGYLGCRVAKRWRQRGDTVYALSRRSARSEQLRKQGLLPLIGDITEPDSLPPFPDVDTALFAVGYDRSAGKAIHDVYVSGLQNVLDALPLSLRRLIYISSTGVYGQDDGQWIDEESPCEPIREGGKACLAAEQLLAEHPLGERAIVLRLAGIYGPDRLPLAATLREGKPLPANPTARLNLIHVDDAEQAVLAAERLTTAPRTILVSDGHPCSRGDFYREISSRLGLEEPTFDPSAGHGARGGDKRVSNRRMMEELRVDLHYPTYREGLASCVG